MSPVAGGQRRDGDLRWRPRNRNWRLGDKAFQKSESAGDQISAIRGLPPLSRSTSSRGEQQIVASHCMACELSKVSSVHVGSTLGPT